MLWIGIVSYRKYRKINKGEYKVQDQTTDARIDKGKGTEWEILEQLYKNSSLSSSELCKNTGFKRDKVNRVTKKLIEKNLIMQDKNGKFQLTINAAMNPKLQSTIFGMDAFRELLNGVSSSLFMENFISINQTYDIANQEHLFFSDIKKGKNLTKESEILFDFAITIGSLITFIMLKAVKPSEKEDMNGKEKEEQSLTWIRNSIIPSVIFSQFMEMDIIKKGKRIKKSRENKILNNMNSAIPPLIKEEYLARLISDDLYSPYEIDNKTYQSLEKAFFQIWPFTHIVLKELSQPQRLIRKGEYD